MKTSFFPMVRREVKAFTMVELLLSITILAMLMTFVAEVISRTQSTVAYAKSRTEEFQEARAAFEAVVSRVSQASMEATWSYRWNTNVNNSYLERVSDHHFVLGQQTDLLIGNEHAGQAVFFQAPLGFAGTIAGTSGSEALSLERAHGLINCWGYYVENNSDLDPDRPATMRRPAFLTTPAAQIINPERRRFRLMEFRLPSEQTVLYSNGTTGLNLNTQTKATTAYKWFQGPFKDGKMVSDYSTPLADNILVMVLVPHFIETTATTTGTGSARFFPTENYRYDTRMHQWGDVSPETKRSRHQLPAMIQVTLIATDEASFDNLEVSSGNARDAVDDLIQGKFISYARHTDDIAAVESGLTDLGLHFKTFSTAVALRGAKWITEQE